ncbi:MAG TPA: hypothetical protein VK980_07095, partial [Sphingomonas sp.]|nr:hypothetical protein [Sphingomonas sp.]
MTDDADPGNAPSTGLVLTPKVAFVVAVCLSALFFLLDDVLGLINGGGLFSVRSAFHAASEHAAVVNVDSAGLRTLFVLLCTIVVIAPASVLRANVSRRLVGFAVFVPIIAGGFVVDIIYDEGIVGHFLEARGYVRCENGDFHVGNGKSRVWF